jgi:hypothetical protein
MMARTYSNKQRMEEGRVLGGNEYHWEDNIEQRGSIRWIMEA